MKDKDSTIFTIKKVNFSGKWMEFWFEEKRLHATRSGWWHECCKSYMFNTLLKEKWLSHIYSNGLKGYRVKWKEDRPIKLYKPKKVNTKTK